MARHSGMLTYDEDSRLLWCCLDTDTPTPYTRTLSPSPAALPRTNQTHPRLAPMSVVYNLHPKLATY